MKRLFITGTDTGVGKTVVTAGLAAWCREEGIDAGIMKPIETGVENGVPRDGRFHKQTAGLDDPLDQIVPVQYEEPLAPNVAANRANRPVPMNRIEETFQSLSETHDLLFVEGAGGLLVPINEQKTMADLATAWRLPTLIIARPSLGTLNHSALTVDVARRHGLEVPGIVISGFPDHPDTAERTNPSELERLTDTTVLGKIPRIDGLNTDEEPDDNVIEQLTKAIGDRMKLREMLPELLVNNIL